MIVEEFALLNLQLTLKLLSSRRGRSGGTDGQVEPWEGGWSSGRGSEVAQVIGGGRSKGVSPPVCINMCASDSQPLTWLCFFFFPFLQAL